MTREQAKQILGENATEEQVTNLLNQVHNMNKVVVDELNNAKTQLGKYADYDDVKKKLDEIEKAKMTEQEKIDLANKEAQLKLAQANKIYNTAKAKEILSGLEDDEDIISTIVRDDENETVRLATKLKEKYISIQDSVAKKTKEELSTLNLKPDMGEAKPIQDDGKMTMDKFMKMSIDEQNKFTVEHSEEFANL